MHIRFVDKSAIVASLAALLLGSSIARSADWPQFHGPQRDNRSTETGLLKQWPDGGPKLLWTARGLGHGFASVSIADGRIYTSGNLSDRTVVASLDPDGRQIWQAENGPPWTKSVPGTRSTPTIDGDRVYHESPLGELVCLDARSGEKLWRLNLLERFHAPNINWGLSESVLIDGDRLICCPGGPETAVVALGKLTGETIWKSPSAGDPAGYASPSLGEYGGVRMFFTLTARALIGVHAETGEILFRFEHTTPFEENIFMPLYYDGHVFISTRTTGSVLLKLHVQGQEVSVEPVWRSEQLDNQHGGVLLLDGYLYGACHVRNNGKWVSLDWKTGREMYADRGIGRGSLTCADGMLYVLNERREVALVRPAPAAHEIVSRFEIPEGGEGPTWAHPVVCGGRLYIRHSDRLYAYDIRDYRPPELCDR